VISSVSITLDRSVPVCFFGVEASSSSSCRVPVVFRNYLKHPSSGVFIADNRLSKYFANAENNNAPQLAKAGNWVIRVWELNAAIWLADGFLI
jgi:hypothetical protein